MKKVLYALFAVLVIGVSVLTMNIVSHPTKIHEIKYFSSYAELSDFLKTRSEGGYGVSGGEMRALAAVESASAFSGVTAGEYSTTNIQVEGVDEPDIVKTDGKYIYTISGDAVIIVDAYPAETASMVSRIQVNGTITNIFVNKNKLVAFTSGWYVPRITSSASVAESKILPYRYSSNSMIYVYDISDKTNPMLVRNISVEGNYYNARMLGDYIYTIINQPVQVVENNPALPVVYINSEVRTIDAENIAYSDTYDNSFIYAHVIAINTQNDAEEPVDKVFLFGRSQNLYVSAKNIYAVYTKKMSSAEYNRKILDAVMPKLPSSLRAEADSIWNSQNMSSYEKMSKVGEVIRKYAESLGPEGGAKFMKDMEEAANAAMVEIERENEKTVVHKIAVAGANIEYKASAEVPGRVLNQFSMDEYNGNFRIATTTGQSWRNTSLNHVYVLDSELRETGRLENLARGEQIYSARFMGDRAYLVTFKRTDPLFVIDLSNPSAPSVLGELKMPGFSDYLHPYDSNYLIGFGQQTDENGRTTGQLKLSLFDVSDVSNPKEKSVYLIGSEGDWAYSEALRDHKAFLFSKSKNLLVIPVSINNWRGNRYSQGAFVFDLTADGGFTLKGQITHTLSNASEEERYYDYTSSVRRALYMDANLYTISNSIIKANNMADLSEIKAVNLNH